MRTGVIAKKVGMTRLFQEDGRHVPVTVLALEDVPGRRAPRDASATAMSPSSSAPARPRRRTSPSRSAAISARPRSSPRRSVAEFRVDRGCSPRRRREISADHFVAGQMVDVQGITQGKGFAGAMKRWGFGGLRATHGVSVSHRSHGSTGQRQDPGRSSRTRRWPATWATASAPSRTSKSSAPTPTRGLIFVKGSVPGHKGGWLLVRTRSRSPRPDSRPVSRRGPRGARAPLLEHEEAPAGMVEAAAVHEIAAAAGRRRSRRPASPRPTPHAAEAAAEPSRPSRPTRRGRRPGADESKEG